MQPAWVLNLQPGDDPQEKLQEWLDEYARYATESPDTAQLASALAARARTACRLILERRNHEPVSDSHDEAYYIETARLEDAENALLDGAFPLGNERDMRFASACFPLPDLVRIQLGYFDRVSCGQYVEHAEAVLIKRGFLAEMRGEWAEAARCYEGVTHSQAVQEREYACREKASATATPQAADGSAPCPADEHLQERLRTGDPDAFWQMAQQCRADNDADGTAAWFNRAIEAGQVDALIAAAKVYLDKGGVFYNKRLATSYLRRAADRGSAQAIMALGDLELADTSLSFWEQAARLRNLKRPDKEPKRKLRGQHKKQMAWYRLAAEAGDTDAMSALSMAYHLGYPEGRSDAEAFLWASRAADAGDGAAMYQAAYFYENGFGTAKDVDAALLLYTEAAEAGIRSAMIRLYEIYTTGLDHILPDGQKAARYLFLSGEERD